ncbi:MAG: hypothetical protein AAF214_02095 [Pseudomonadota bacterium]
MPTVVPTGTQTPISKAFKSPLKPDMFEIPEEMEEAVLNDACLKFNYALYNAKRTTSTSELFKALVAAGLPEAGEMGEVPPDALGAYTDIVWAAANDGNRAFALEAWTADGNDADDFAYVATPMPSMDDIKQTMVEWKSATPAPDAPSITKFRAGDIGSAKVDTGAPQRAFIKPEDLAGANDRLREMGSFVHLEVAGDADDDGFVPVRPVFDTTHVATPDPLGRDDHTVLQAINTKRQAELEGGAPAEDESKFVSWADCHRTAQIIMGSEDQPGGFGDVERPVCRGTRGEIVVEPVSMSGIQFIENGSNSGANRAMHGFFNTAIPTFLSDFEDTPDDELTEQQAAIKAEVTFARRERRQTLEAAQLVKARSVLDKELDTRKDDMEDKDHDALDKMLVKAGKLLEVGKLHELAIAERLETRRARIDEASGLIDDVKRRMDFEVEEDATVLDVPLNLRGAYREICKDPDVLDEFSKQFGVNAYCKPEVGDALTQVNDEGMKISKEGEGEDIWNFHWAGVVLVNEDGSFMTLENLSVEDMRAVNTDWYFAAYKPGKESFHAVNEKDSHVTEFPLTMAIKKTD